MLVLFSRLPFISDGFGLDSDSWSVAINAKLWHVSGVYSPSRFPCYPVHEFLCSLLTDFGARGMNLLSAIASAIAVLFFALTLRLLRFKYVFLAAAAFAFTPVFYLSATVTIDYDIALAFIMISMYFILRGKIFYAGIFLGIAIGTRITSGAMVIPFSIMLFDDTGTKNLLRKTFMLLITAVATACLIYLPAFGEFGLTFLTYYDVPYPSIPKILYKFAIEVWGVIGFAGIIIATGLLFLPERKIARKYLFPRGVNEKFVIAWLVAIDLYIIAFLKLPMESGYLVPLVPYVILIFGKYLYDRAFVFFCCMLILSSFIATISPKDRQDSINATAATLTFNSSGEKLYFDPLKGPVISLAERRKKGIDFVNNIIESADTISRPSVLVAGRWYNQLIVQSKDTTTLKMRLRFYLSEEEAVYFYAKGYEIYFLPKQDYYNKLMKKVDLDIYGAQPYLKIEK